MQSQLRLPQSDCIRGGAFYYIIMSWNAHEESEDPSLDNVYHLKINISAKDSAGERFCTEVLVDSASYDKATELALDAFKEHFGVRGSVESIKYGYYLTA